MKQKIKNSLFILTFVTANQVFAAKFYFEAYNNKKIQNVIIGDLDFSYTFEKSSEQSTEVFQRGLTQITIVRSENGSSMLVEQKTRFGFLSLKYKNVGNNWENNQVSFRPYNVFFMIVRAGSTANAVPVSPVGSCERPPPDKNKNDIGLVSTDLRKQNFSNLFFDKNCAEKLTAKEFEDLTGSAFTLFADDNLALGKLTKPIILQCVQGNAFNSPIYNPFRTLRGQVQLILDDPSSSMNNIQKKTSSLFPISCDLEGKACGQTKEGIITKTSLNVACLKADPTNFRTAAQAIMMHEFSHQSKHPPRVGEEQIRNLEQGHCDVKDTNVLMPDSVLLASSKEVTLDKMNYINSEKNGPQIIGKDIADPYKAFAEQPTQQAKSPTNQNTNIASKETVSSDTQVSDSTQRSNGSQRSIASFNTANNSRATTSLNTSIPAIEQQAQYYNTKALVNASVSAVAQRITPVVNYIESPAFAATLPPTSFENGNGPNSGSSASDLPIGTTATAAKAVGPTRRATTASGSANGSNEIASNDKGRGGSAAILSSGGSSSTSAGRGLASVSKTANRKTNIEGVLNNAYAVQIRKRLASDEKFREEVRSQGIQIMFADGLEFKSPTVNKVFKEEDGVLRGK